MMTGLLPRIILNLQILNGNRYHRWICLRQKKIPKQKDLVQNFGVQKQKPWTPFHKTGLININTT